ncbi:hypothetical protein J437_LFUL009582 [Ladona fulva]|uniref:Uncharacterized protein n=1 Tax=Ladona fulva TaxID=123851 RepID=A0A8K0P1H7_LADFU|nr:hypothetical protein J437_LFUL009582 [Ladona fulva]
MQNLEKEKALVIGGHDEVVKIVEGMHQKLDQASSQMDALLTERESSHNKLVKNVHKLQLQVKQLLQQIDHSVQIVRDQNEEIAAKYRDAIENLAQINTTVHYLVEILEVTQSELDAWVQWMSSVLGGRDHTLVMFALMLHLGYLLLGMVAMAFLGAPFISRLLLLILVPVNLLLTVNQDLAMRKAFPYTIESLDFQTITVIIVTFTLGNLIISYLTNVCRNTIWANKPAKCNQFAEVPTAKRIPLSGVDAPAQNNWSSRFLSGMKVLDPRSWWSSNEADNGRNNWSKDLSTSASQAYKPDIDDSSDTDGPLVIEKDDDDDYYAEVFTRHSFERAFTPNRLQKNSTNEYHSPLATSLHDKLRRSSTPKNTCSAICQNGQPCRNSCMNGHLLCHRHSLSSQTRN